MNAKNIYFAVATNDQGASIDVLHSRGTSKANAKMQARDQFGSGWKIHIIQVLVDGDGQSVIGAEEVETFRIR